MEINDKEDRDRLITAFILVHILIDKMHIHSHAAKGSKFFGVQILRCPQRTYPGLVKEPCVEIRFKNKMLNSVMGHFYTTTSVQMPTWESYHGRFL